MITDLKISPAAKREYYRKGYWTSDTIADVWARQARAAHDRLYVVDDHGTALTYGQCDDMASRIAGWLDDAGVRAGDVVTVQLPTWAEFCPLYVAVAKVGAVLHPLARNYSVHDLAYAMNLVDSRALICPVAHHTTNYEVQAKELLSQVPTLDAGRVLLVDKVGDELPHAFDTMRRVLAGRAPLRETHPVSSDSVACILSTSGTTGTPKQVLLTHNNVLFSERAFVAGLGLTADDVMFMPSPLNHATGLFHGLVSPMILGGSTVLQQDFDARRAVELVNATGATWSMGATPFVHDILGALEADGTRLETLRLFLSGGAPLPAPLVERAAAHGLTLCECYGSTESCPHAYVPPEQCAAWGGRWSGRALPGIEVRVVDEQHREVPRGMLGEEASRGPQVFVGYLGAPEETARVLDNDGWFYSGDLARMDDEGRIHICGRKKEIIIRGGENISMREVCEAVLGWHDVIDHAVVGVTDERMGERVCLFAVPRPGLGHGLRLDDLRAYLAEKGVSKRLWPERVEAIDRIPRTPTGKVRRGVLARELERRDAAR